MESSKFNEIKSLIKVKENIFTRISKFFRNLFYRYKQNNNGECVKENQNEKYKLYEEFFNNEDINFLQDDEINIDIETVFDIEENPFSQIKNKEEFFQMYENIKKGKEDIENLSIEELLKVDRMIKEEISLKLSDFGNSDAEELETELKKVQIENKMLIEELKKLENM